MANVEVVSAVLGNTKEYQPIVKTMWPCPLPERLATVAMKKKKTAKLKKRVSRIAQRY